MARVRTGMRTVAKAARMEDRTIGRKAVARKERKGKRKAARGDTRTCWTCGKTGHIAIWCLYTIDEDGPSPCCKAEE